MKKDNSLQVICAAFRPVPEGSIPALAPLHSPPQAAAHRPHPGLSCWARPGPPEAVLTMEPDTRPSLGQVRAEVNIGVKNRSVLLVDGCLSP